ncbi:MAG: uracil-DNA glycosylase [gamma proteobacterium symbiont of Taylorina sp.]|nr:uracil-DNA glycosylase [gamma proteobacterium symbiont of Taylorina sp.]
MNKNLKQQYLNEIGIQTWLIKSSPDDVIIEEIVDNSSSSDQVPTLEQVDNIPVNKSIRKITSCSLCSSRKNHLKVLSGEGNADAQVFFICEAPNAAEEREGHYLTDDSHSLFKKMLDVIGITNNYFFTGLIKCHSFENFLISEAEINNCRSHLITQLEQVKPDVLILLGTIQAQALLKSTDSFNQLRNKIHTIEINNQSYQAIVSYHPAYLLRNPLYKKEALKDLILIKSVLQ